MVGKTTAIWIACGLLMASAQAVDLERQPVRAAMQQQLLASGAASSDPAGLFGDDDPADDQTNFGRKSSSKAFLYSLLVPGWGQHYCGYRRTARAFFAVEAASWLGFVAFRTYGGWKEDDYIRFAEERAGAQLAGKPDWFVDMVSFYDDLEQYNQLGRAIDRGRPYLSNSPANSWQWTSRNDKISFRVIKNRSREAYRRSDFMIGAMVINRMVSAIHAVRIAKKTGRRLDDLAGAENERAYGYRVNTDPFSDNIQLGLTVFTRF